MFTVRLLTSHSPSGQHRYFFDHNHKASRLTKIWTDAIRQLVKQRISTSHVQVGQNPKGKACLISQTIRAQQYPNQAEPLSAMTAQAQEPAVTGLQRQLAKRDQVVQQLQNCLLEQDDALNALTNQMNSQCTECIDKLLLSQGRQLYELPKRLPEPGETSLMLTEPEPTKERFWQRVSGK